MTIASVVPACLRHSPSLLSRYLDAEEAKQVKIALAHFMKNKDPPELVDKLSQVSVFLSRRVRNAVVHLRHPL